MATLKDFIGHTSCGLKGLLDRLLCKYPIRFWLKPEEPNETEFSSIKRLVGYTLLGETDALLYLIGADPLWDTHTKYAEMEAAESIEFIRFSDLCNDLGFEVRLDDIEAAENPEGAE